MLLGKIFSWESVQEICLILACLTEYKKNMFCILMIQIEYRMEYIILTKNPRTQKQNILTLKALAFLDNYCYTKKSLDLK